MANDNKRYICSFVKKINNEFIPNVVVIIASNLILARAVLVDIYGVNNVMVDKDQAWRNNVEGIKTIRLSETNTYALVFGRKRQKLP